MRVYSLVLLVKAFDLTWVLLSLVKKALMLLVFELSLQFAVSLFLLLLFYDPPLLCVSANLSLPSFSSPFEFVPALETSAVLPFACASQVASVQLSKPRYLPRTLRIRRQDVS